MGNISSTGVIGISAGVSVLGLAGGIALVVFKPEWFRLKTASAPVLVSTGTAFGSMTEFGFSIIDWLPMALFAFGFIADIIGQQFFLSMASFSGLAGIVVNSILGLMLNKK